MSSYYLPKEVLVFNQESLFLSPQKSKNKFKVSEKVTSLM